MRDDGGTSSEVPAGSACRAQPVVPQRLKRQFREPGLPHHPAPHRAHRDLRGAQLPPAAGGARLRRGRVGDRRRGTPLPRLPGRLLRAELRARPPAPRRGRARAAGPADADQPGVLQRPARAVRAGALRPHREGPDPADELRRGGRRDRDQGQPQVGLPGQGRAGEPGDDRGDGGQLPRAHHDDRLVLHRPRRDATATRRTPRASGWCRTATSRRCGRRSTTRRWPCCSSPCRARPASSSRRRATSTRCASCASSSRC